MKINNLTMTGTRWWPVFCDSLSLTLLWTAAKYSCVLWPCVICWWGKWYKSNQIKALFCGWGENTEYLGSSLTTRFPTRGRNGSNFSQPNKWEIVCEDSLVYAIDIFIENWKYFSGMIFDLSRRRPPTTPSATEWDSRDEMFNMIKISVDKLTLLFVVNDAMMLHDSCSYFIIQTFSSLIFPPPRDWKSYWDEFRQIFEMIVLFLDHLIPSKLLPWIINVWERWDTRQFYSPAIKQLS